MNRLSHGDVDIHQHLWPGELVDALRARRAPPRLAGWRLELAGEGEHRADPRDHDPAWRAEQARADGVATALVSLSSALGIESLPAGEANELLEAWHEGALALPAPFGAWASAGLCEIDPDGLERRLEQGFAGLALPATALSGRAGYAHVAPLLEVLEREAAPLFIHPGPSAPGPDGAPPWWPPLVDYVSQMHAAWFAFRVHGRPRHPRLRVVFALLAGLAPLHGERFAARAGTRSTVDELAFLETSSYGTRAIDATVRVLGIDVLVHGSDRPYAAPPEPDLGAAARHALRCANPIRLLHAQEVPDGALVTAGPQS